MRFNTEYELKYIETYYSFWAYLNKNNPIKLTEEIVKNKIFTLRQGKNIFQNIKIHLENWIKRNNSGYQISGETRMDCIQQDNSYLILSETEKIFISVMEKESIEFAKNNRIKELEELLVKLGKEENLILEKKTPVLKELEELNKRS